jgi:hypothetical protein
MDNKGKSISGQSLGKLDNGDNKLIKKNAGGEGFKKPRTGNRRQEQSVDSGHSISSSVDNELVRDLVETKRWPMPLLHLRYMIIFLIAAFLTISVIFLIIIMNDFSNLSSIIRSMPVIPKLN